MRLFWRKWQFQFLSRTNTKDILTCKLVPYVKWLEPRDEWIPLFSDIRIHGYLGYWFFLDTWISGYLDIMDTRIHGYLDTWISVFFGYVDTWILWISIFFIIHHLDILSKYPDIFGYSFKLLNVRKRQSNSSVKTLVKITLSSLS